MEDNTETFLAAVEMGMDWGLPLTEEEQERYQRIMEDRNRDV